MREQGVITRVISKNLVEVACQRSEACKNCGACHDIGENMMAIEAVDHIQAKKDDVVEFDIPSAELVKSSFVVFIVPIIFLMIGYLLTIKALPLVGLVETGEWPAILGGLLFLVASYFAINWYDRRVQLKESSRARLIRVISPR